jgi:hypothetical protein
MVTCPSARRMDDFCDASRLVALVRLHSLLLQVSRSTPNVRCGVRAVRVCNVVAGHVAFGIAAIFPCAGVVAASQRIAAPSSEMR